MDTLQKQMLVEAYPGFLKLATKILDNQWYAQDIVQDAVLKTLTSAADVQNPVYYCLRIVKRECFSLLRKSKYIPLDLTEIPFRKGTDPDYEHFIQELGQAFEELPGHFQRLLELRYVENLPKTTIAKICNIHRDTVQRRLTLAKESFKSRLQTKKLV